MQSKFQQILEIVRDLEEQDLSEALLYTHNDVEKIKNREGRISNFYIVMFLVLGSLMGGALTMLYQQVFK